MGPPRPVNLRVQVSQVWRRGSGLAKTSGRSHFGAVVVTGGIVTALALLLVSQPAAVDAPDANPVRIEVAGAVDPAWVLARIDVLLDGVPQAPADEDGEEAPEEANDQEEGETPEGQAKGETADGQAKGETPESQADGETADGQLPVWSGVVAPGPHHLAALLVFRPRDANLAGDADRTIRVEAQHLFPARPIRPLVLLITPVRPAPAPAPDLLLARYTLAPE
jgi:hypothetical protein